MLRRHAAFLVLLAFTGCSDPEPAPTPSAAVDVKPRKVTLQLNWYPEVEHGGFYAAHVNGYFREEGLDVEILAGGAEVPVPQRVASGHATFGVANADQILLVRAQEADVVALMAPMQVSPRCLMVHASSGAKSFGDLKGMTIAMGDGEPYAAFLKPLLPDDVKIVPYTGGVSHFLRDPKHAQQGYTFSEPLLARAEGGDPHVLLVADAGFNPYASCLIASGKTVKDDEDLARRMTRACIRGWEDYLENPTPANTAIHNDNPEMNLEFLALGVAAMRPLCVPEGEAGQPFGRMTAERWDTLVKQMEDSGSLKPGAVNPREAFRAEFVTGDVTAK